MRGAFASSALFDELVRQDGKRDTGLQAEETNRRDMLKFLRTMIVQALM
jgi:hypothetical protein